MKTLGLVGGIGSEATHIYLRQIDELTAYCFGGRHIIPVIVNRVNGFKFESASVQKNWALLESLTIQASLECEVAGAETILLGSSVFHAVADKVAAKLTVPLLHLADAAMDVIANAGIRRIAILGLCSRPEQLAWQGRCTKRRITMIQPGPDATARIITIIRDELSRGQVLQESHADLVRICYELGDSDAQVIVLAAPELSLALHQGDAPLPILHAVSAHAAAAVTWSTAAPLDLLPTAPCAIANQ